MVAPTTLISTARQATTAAVTTTATARLITTQPLATTPLLASLRPTALPTCSADSPRRFLSYKYPFPSVPRPRRNLLYYYNPMATIKRGLKKIPASRPAKFMRKTTSLKWPSLGKLSSFRRPAATSQPLLSRAASQPRYGTFARIPGYRRFASAAGNGAPREAASRAASAASAASWKWWAVPAVTTIILWTAMRRKKPEDEENSEPTAPRPAKPWQVAAYSTLPLKAMSRLWGRVNDITLPVWMREPGFKFFAYVFGANLDELAEPDLTKYRNLGEFFFRELKDGARPIDSNAPLVSPADGTMLHLGVIRDRKVEQVKGITYSLDALLGGGDHAMAAPSREVDFELHDQEQILERHKDFAIVNGINYTLDELIGDSDHAQHVETSFKVSGDATADTSMPLAQVSQVTGELLKPDFTPSSEKELFFAVIYLAPGDYHRFHSPADWVSSLRRHFVGELYSVAPYFQSRLEGLFCLNERVALLGRWRHGFFSMTPVGATNVGSILVHFDKDLRTNTVYENGTSDAIPSEQASRRTSINGDSGEESDEASMASTPVTESTPLRRKKVKKATCYEATYYRASPLLGGYPLTKGQEMGGFNLGSTVVLVFEAPKTFQFNVKAGEKVKVGQALGTYAD